MSGLCKTTLLLGILLTLISPLWAVNQPESLDYLFKNREEGYKCFRIPATVQSVKGTVLAFAEGRKNGCSDTGSIDLVLKRSLDGGRTWGPLQVVWTDGDNTCGNPAPVVDKTTGRIFLLSTWNLGSDRESEIINQESKDTRRVFLLDSEDDGMSWSAPEEITDRVKKPNWTWYATGPVHGIQLESGRFKGRMVIPCDHIEAETGKYRSHVIYSDDHGDTWRLGGIIPQDQVNECTVVELDNGELMLNMRNYDRSRKNRRVSRSSDGGESWSDISVDQVLVEPICQASILNFRRSSAPGILLFMNPASPEKRMNMLLRASMDQGKTWERSRVLHSGPSAYGDIVQINEREVLLLLEAGRESPYEGIAVKGPFDIDSFFSGNQETY